MSGVSRDIPNPVQPLRILVDGMDPCELAAQTLHNVWRSDEHAQQELLGRLEVSGSRLLPNALEKSTWALLCWSCVDQIHLMDERAGVVVARLTRSKSVANQHGGKIHVWRDTWLKEAGGSSEWGDVAAPAEAFPPSARTGSDLWNRLGFSVLYDPSSAGVAKGERVKLRIQRALGHRIASLLQRGYQWSSEQLRRARRRSECSLNTALPSLVRMSEPFAKGDKICSVLIMVPRLDPGGAEKNIIDLATRLSGLGAKVIMMTTVASKNSWKAHLLGTSVEFFDLPGFLNPDCWFSFVKTILTARRVTHFHVMNSHWAYEQLPAIARLFPDLKVLTQLHAEGEQGTMDFPALAARYDRFVNTHTVISAHLADYMHGSLGVARDHIRLIRTGVDLKDFRVEAANQPDWRSVNGISQNTAVVIFVGRFSELKRPLLFLSIAQRVLQSRQDVLFVLKGQGPLEGAIRRLLAASPRLSDRVLVEGVTEPVAPLMASADLLVLPSRMEGIAYVSYEAMALGLPQVYAAVGGQAELLGSDAGIAVTPGPQELQAYVNAVVTLLDQGEQRRRMGDAARARIAAWPTPDDAASAYFLLYSEGASC